MAFEKIGIDLIGFPRGKLGIGEQLRSLLRLAIKAGYKINVIDCYHESDEIENDHSEFDEFISNEFKYPLRIYSLTQNHLAALIYRYGTQYFNNAMNIFHLAWEFESRPTQLDFVLKFSEQIWGISDFTSKSFVNDFGITVKTMHNSVEIPKFEKKSRKYFGIPEDKFLFCFSFDFNSWLTRKNPTAVIEAFKKAFPFNSNVGLVIKVSNVNEQSSLWSKIFESINDCNSIYIINEVLERDVLFSLFDNCDSYVSLHRSEGFGLGIAENMLLGKPVICTSYSGNIDFCNQKNSYLVDYELVKVVEGEYPFSDGCNWAEPSVDSASKLMKEVYENKEMANLKMLQAKQDIERDFSIESLAKTFEKHIECFIESRNSV